MSFVTIFMLLSIIIPYYHNPKNLSRCLKSLSEQTVFDHELAPCSVWSHNGLQVGTWSQQIEVIIVDDGSTPPLVEASRRDNLQDDFYSLGEDAWGSRIEIKFYRIEHSGASAARNFGFSKSSGKYIFFCDADVTFLKNDALEKMLKILEENPDRAYCYSSFKYGFKIFKCGEFDAEKIKEDNYISTMSLIQRDTLLKLAPPNSPFDESLARFQDWDLWLTLLEHGETGIFIDEILWQAKNGGTISHWLPKMFYKFPFLKKIKEYNKAKEVIKKKHNL